MRVLHRPLLLASLLVASSALAACGDSDDPPSAGSGTGAAAPTTTAVPVPTTTSATPPKTPAERVAAASEALRQVQSFHVEGTETDEEDGTYTITGDIHADGTKSLTLVKSETNTIRLRVIGTATYIYADPELWSEAGPEAVDLYSNVWVKAPSTGFELASAFETLSPRGLAGCLSVGVGSLRDGKPASVDGRAADVVIDRGDKPGTAPGRLFIAKDGPPLPLRLQTTGKSRPGGKPDPKCDPDGASTTASDLVLSRFDEPVKIEAPKDAVVLDDDDDSTADPDTT